MHLRVALGLLTFAVCSAPIYAEQTATTVVDFAQNDFEGRLQAKMGSHELFVYNYRADQHLPYFYPLNTPSGKNLLVDKTLPYPHHRAFWVSDTVIRDGVKGDVYNSYYSGRKLSKNEYAAPYNTASRHLDFSLTTSTSGIASITENLVWETGLTTSTFPLLDEHRMISIHGLPGGDYLMDFRFSLTASYGDVEFVSDAVHYAWPFLRLNSEFSGENGGVLTSDTGTTGQALTNLKAALWMDFSNCVNGTTEGVALLQWPEGEPRQWLTRDYGTFGPRRPAAQSGKPFVLSKGKSLSQRLAIYVHRGDVTSGNVADIYVKYINGGFDR